MRPTVVHGDRLPVCDYRRRARRQREQAEGRFNAADQAAARAAALRRSDLGSGADWKGGAKKAGSDEDRPLSELQPEAAAEIRLAKILAARLRA
jgi:hypothetical protein